MKTKYQWSVDIPEAHIKKGMTISWNSEEQEYTTEDLPWMISPLMSRAELNHRIKLGQILKGEKGTE